MTVSRITVVNHTGTDLVPFRGAAGEVGPVACPDQTIPDHGCGQLDAGGGATVFFTEGRRMHVGVCVRLVSDDGPARLVSVVQEYRGRPDVSGEPKERGRYRLVLDADTTDVSIDVSRDFTVRYDQHRTEGAAG